MTTADTINIRSLALESIKLLSAVESLLMTLQRNQSQTAPEYIFEIIDSLVGKYTLILMDKENQPQ